MSAMGRGPIQGNRSRSNWLRKIQQPELRTAVQVWNADLNRGQDLAIHASIGL
jgi:hypothetical protein